MHIRSLEQHKLPHTGPRARWRSPIGGVRGPLVSILALFVGCSAPSFLVTPVSHKRALVETVLMRDSAFAVDKIALIDISGVMLNAPESGLFGSGKHPVSLLLEQLDKARQDKKVKAVILRINSPGGGVVASELMHSEVEHFKKQGKPIVAVMMDVAASGGYYVACACDEIVAYPSTITGSIGVVMQLFDVAATMEYIGIKSNTIISGPRKDSGSPFRALRPEERELFQAIVDEMYDRFVEIVAKGRPKLDEQGVRAIADGRVYTASQALKLGLIDRISTMREVISSIKADLGGKPIRLVSYKRPYGYRPNYYSRTTSRSGNAINLVNIELPGLPGANTPRFMYLWQPGL